MASAPFERTCTGDYLNPGVTNVADCAPDLRLAA